MQKLAWTLTASAPDSRYALKLDTEVKVGQMVDLDINAVRLGRCVPSSISQWPKKSAVLLDLHHTYQLVREHMAKLDTEGQNTIVPLQPGSSASLPYRQSKTSAAGITLRM